MSSSRGGKAGPRSASSRDSSLQAAAARDFTSELPDSTPQSKKKQAPKTQKSSKPAAAKPQDLDAASSPPPIPDSTPPATTSTNPKRAFPPKDHTKPSKPSSQDVDRPAKSYAKSNTAATSQSSQSFDFSKLKPFTPDNECMICSSPILLYAGSTCDHMDELCGECLLKLKLFAKQNASAITINPQTGEEEKHRATVVIKPEYQLLCDNQASAINAASNTSPTGQSATATAPPMMSNTISDPTLDVDFVSQARTRDPSCLFCHTQLSPLLLSRTPIKPATYKLLKLLLEFQSTPKNSDKYTNLQSQLAELFTELQNSGTTGKKPITNAHISKYVETNFIYNTHLDVYTLVADGIEFAETIENTCAITCKKCVQHGDNQRDYSGEREMKLDFNGFPVTYQSTPSILPPIAPINFSHTAHYTTTPANPETPADSIPLSTACSITSLAYHHASFSSLRQLQHHVQNAHHLDICTACSSVSHDFISSHPLYTHKDLLHHGRQQKHSFCTLCRHQAYDNDELYLHLIDQGNKHMMCSLCTVTTTPNPSDLAPGQPAIKKETFKFFRNKAAYVLHLHQHHNVCTHDKCKQWSSGTDPSSVRNPQRIVAFSTPLELQQHQQNVHAEKKQSGQAKKIDITAMFLSGGSTTSDSAPLPGQARQKPVVGKNDKGEEYKLSQDDILVYSRVVQLAGHHSADSLLTSLNTAPPQGSAARSTASVDIVAEGSFFNTDRRNELFPSLGSAGSTTTTGPTRTKAANQELFPTLGGGKFAVQQVPEKSKKASNTEAFPSLGGGGFKSTSSSTTSQTPASSSYTPATTVVAKSSTPTPLPQPSTKKSNLQAFINWDRVNSNQAQPQLRHKEKKIHTPDFYDYDLHQLTSDSSVPSYAQQYYQPAGGNTNASFAEAMGASKVKEEAQKDKKNLTGDHSVDFPSFLGTSATPAAVPKVKQAVVTKSGKGDQKKKGKQVVQLGLTNAWAVPTQQAATQQKPAQSNQQKQKELLNKAIFVATMSCSGHNRLDFGIERWESFGEAVG
jgi:hypothetical protein